MMSRTATHLAAFSTMLAQDKEIGGLHQRDLQVIAQCVAYDKPLSVGALARELDLAASHVSRIVEKLVKLRFLRRLSSPLDRRIVLLEPTKQGRALDDRVRAHFESAQPQPAVA